MNKSSKRWKVFVIVLCMLFTMTPGSVFADDSIDSQIVNQQEQDNGSGGEDQTDNDDSDKGDQTDNDDSDKGDQTDDDDSDKEDQTGGDDESNKEDQNENQELPIDGLTPSAIQLTQTMSCWTGSITVRKDVTGERPDSDATFGFTLTGPNNYSYDFDIVGEGSKKIDGLELGTYTITENNVPENYKAKSNGATRTLVFWDLNQTLVFKNEYTKPTTLTIKKEVIGNPGSPAEFTFLVEERHYKHYPPFEEYYVSVTRAAIIGEGEQQIDVDGGYYRVTEIDIPQNYTVDNDQKCKRVNHGENKEVTFKNTYTGPITGSLKIIKIVTGAGIIPETVFDFTVTCLENNEFLETVSVTGGAFVVLEDLEQGNYMVKEEPTVNFYPEDNDYDKPATVVEGSETPVVFTNYYDPEEPTIKVTKEVAPYTLGAAIPVSGFEKSHTFTALNQTVIYRISYSFNDAWERIYGDVSLSDIYDRNGTTSDITYNLLVWYGDELVLPDGFDPDVAYYYIDTLPANGTYTNTAYLYETEPQYRTLVGDGDGIEQGAIASSSAVVVVNYTPGGGGGGGGGSSRTTYYEVTYNANWPAGADLSGTVPTDSKNYTYNTTVSVKGNIDGLNAGTYTFEGWNTKPDGTGTMYLPGNTFNIKEDTILYAQWKLVGEPVADVPVTDSSAAVSAETAGLDDVPKTGDTAPLIPMLLLGLLSLAAITLSRKKTLD